MDDISGFCEDTRSTLGRLPLLLLDSSEEPAGAERLRFDVHVESVRSPEAKHEKMEIRIVCSRSTDLLNKFSNKI